jgi:hypothetical protein
MLDTNLKAQLASYLERISQPVEITASLDDTPASAEMRALLKDIAESSKLITVTESTGGPHRTPSFAVNRPGENHGPRFAGLPMGHEFTSLVLALLQVGGYPPKVEQALLDQIKALDADLEFEVYVSLTCHNCPGRGAGAEPDGRAEPAHQDHHDRGRHLPERDRGTPDHGRSHRVPERHHVRLRPHVAWRKSSPRWTPAHAKRDAEKISAKDAV